MIDTILFAYTHYISFNSVLFQLEDIFNSCSKNILSYTKDKINQMCFLYPESIGYTMNFFFLLLLMTGL